MDSISIVLFAKTTLSSTSISQENEEQCLELINYLKAAKKNVEILTIQNEDCKSTLPQRLEDLRLPIVTCENCVVRLSEKRKQHGKLLLVGDSSELAEACWMTSNQFVGVSVPNKVLACELAQKGLSKYNVCKTFGELRSFIQRYNDISTSLRYYRLDYPQLPSSLPTSEEIHPLTRHLAEMAKRDLRQALELMIQVDCHALKLLLESTQAISLLCDRFYETLKAQKNIFLFGCGASGRLLIFLEKLVALEHPSFRGRVIGTLIGGDSALPRTISKFEDIRKLGPVHLDVSGWQPTDAIVFVSASGSAKIIMEMIELSVQRGARPMYVFGNPYPQLVKQYDTEAIFKRPEINAQIDFVHLQSAPMCITGSSRMQASSVLTLVLGYALLSSFERLAGQTPTPFASLIADLTQRLVRLDCGALSKIVLSEVGTYDQGKKIIYQTSSHNALTVLQDTAERTSTFNLASFRNNNDPPSTNFSYAYINVPDCDTAHSAWEHVLGRPPRTLNLEDYPETSEKMFYGFDLAHYNSDVYTQIYHIVLTPAGNSSGTTKLSLRFNEVDVSLTWERPEHYFSLVDQILQKIVLYTASTMVWVLRGYCLGNIMAYVRPGNAKLLNRIVYYLCNYMRNFDYEYYRLPPTIRTYAMDCWWDIRDIVSHKALTLVQYKSLLLESATLVVDRFLARLYSHLLLHTRNLYGAAPRPGKRCYCDTSLIAKVQASLQTRPAIFVGVDGGGNKCRIMAETESGLLMGACCVPKTSRIVFVEPTWANIREGLEAIFACYNLSLQHKGIAIHACFGLAGSSVPQYVANFLAHSSVKIFSSLRIVRDSDIAQVGAHKMEDGGIIIIGTGSSAIMKYKGEVYQASGRGFPLSDSGSGAYIGLKAAQLLARCFDQEVPWSPLTQELAREFNNNVIKLVDWAKDATPTAFSHLAPAVVKHSAHDPQALKIMQKAAKNIARIYRAIINKVPPSSDHVTVPFSLIGGLANILKKYLPRDILGIIVEPIHPPAKGAILLSKKSVSPATLQSHP